MLDKWLIGNTMRFVATVKLNPDETEVTDATVTGEVKDSAGAVVSGSGFTYTHDTGARYVGYGTSSLALTAGNQYFVSSTATTSSGTAKASLPIIAVNRGPND